MEHPQHYMVFGQEVDNVAYGVKVQKIENGRGIKAPYIIIDKKDW